MFNKFNKLVFAGILVFLWCGRVYSSSDVTVKLNSTDGSTVFAIQDAGGGIVCSINSDGWIRPGPSTHTARYIYDDSGQYAIRCSTHFYTDGTLETAPDQDVIGRGDIVAGGRVFPGSSAGSGGAQWTRHIHDDPANFSTRFSSNVFIEVGALRDRSVTSADLLVTSSCTWATDTVSVDSALDTFVDMPGMYAELNVTAAPAMIFASFSAPVRNSATDQWPRCRVKLFIVDPGGTWHERGFNDGMLPAAGTDRIIPMSVSGAMRVTTTGIYRVRIQWTDGGYGGTAQTAGGRSFYTFWVACP